MNALSPIRTGLAWCAKCEEACEPYVMTVADLPRPALLDDRSGRMEAREMSGARRVWILDEPLCRGCDAPLGELYFGKDG